jgi:hypothetical protein
MRTRYRKDKCGEMEGKRCKNEDEERKGDKNR